MKQKQFKFWMGLGFGFDKAVTGSFINGKNITFTTKSYVFLFMKWGTCEMSIK